MCQPNHQPLAACFAAIAMVLSASGTSVATEGTSAATEGTSAAEGASVASGSDAGSAESAEVAPDQAPSFSRDIQPLFARYCTSCHGGVKQAADISFVRRDSVLPPDGWIIEPGDPDASELLARIKSDDPDLRMPPPEEHPNPLAPGEIELIERWIAAGAQWTDQWSRAALEAPEIPAADRASQWARQPLDYFVYQGLQHRKLTVSREAPPAQWFRRTSLDLIGLPPTAQQLRRFHAQLAAAGDSAAAREAVYTRVVQRLLASTHFGERWAAMWMDLARYADSKGFEKDPHRDMWPYRDWLIDAFNSDMPYDEFTVKQLAGDLLPDSNYQDLIATAFHRNTMTNTEGGTDDEEFRIAAVIDRQNTTWTVWQATTFGCVQCHAHPYEPFDNDEYYKSLALFNNTEDFDLDSDFPTVPWLADSTDREEFVVARDELNETSRQIDLLAARAVKQASWQALPIVAVDSTSGKLSVASERDAEVRVSGGTVAVGSSYTVVATPAKLSAVRISILPESDDPRDWPEQGAVISHLQIQRVTAQDEAVDAPVAVEEIEIDQIIPDHRAGSFDPEEMLKPSKDGFGGYPKLLGPRWVVVGFKEPIELAEGEQLRLQLKQAASVTGGLSNHLRRFRLEYTDSDRFVELSQSTKQQELRSRSEELSKRLKSLKGVRLPVMKERSADAARSTRRFVRGNWLERDELVDPGLPRIFAQSLPAGTEVTDRLQFARWLTSPENPLAARVWVNRIWAELFGLGIVETLEDFGASGVPPSNPELLDHLAHAMQHRHQWSLKSFLRTLVLSATYRQDGRASARERELDLRNRFLARGPRTRLTAEMVRDQALLVAGRLTNRVGGPSVMPPQPEGVWQQAYSNAQWKESQGEDRYRRGLYVYWRRTSPYPGFVMFDTPSRDVCSARRIVTNTPLQALVTLNSRVFTELAGDIAQRIGTQFPEDYRSAISQVFLEVASRPPAPADLEQLVRLYRTIEEDRNASRHVQRPPTPEGAERLRQRREALSPLGIVALAILNSDWALTK